MKKTLGGDRLGAGKKMTVELHNYGRSTHNLSKVFRSPQAVGTLVPYDCEIGLNGTTFYLDIETKVRTLPTNGPIFGAFKHQIDVFQIPIRLYIGALHNNALNIGLNMSNIKLPKNQYIVQAYELNSENPNSDQIAQDSLDAYLGLRGLGRKTNLPGFTLYIKKPNMFNLAYWDIYKNYYSNKQEGIGYVITGGIQEIAGLSIRRSAGNQYQLVTSTSGEFPFTYSEDFTAQAGDEIVIQTKNGEILTQTQLNDLAIFTNNGDASYKLGEVTTGKWQYDSVAEYYYATVKYPFSNDENETVIRVTSSQIKLTEFDLANIDEMREKILATPKTIELVVDGTAKMPYAASCGTTTTANSRDSKGNGSYFNQAGLGIKTYLSDRFNNWLSTEWLDGENGINEITSIDVTDGKLSMDELILNKKLYELLNRIAISGGTYNDWQEAVYGETSIRMAESPIYEGGMSSTISFDEVVSTAETETGNGSQPLGALAGRGSDKGYRGGSSIKIKCREPSMLMIIGSITPKIGYSQGNKWWTRLESMDDFHKPGLDGIAFQELITDEMAAFDTSIEPTVPNGSTGKMITKSAGKQPSWIEYMTNVDESYGEFTTGKSLDFMTLNRGYEFDGTGIKDLTTYIDPTKFNYAFAQADLNAQNFWVQVGINLKARRKMSAKQIPNL